MRWLDPQNSITTMSFQVDQLFWFLVVLCSLTAVLIIALIVIFSTKYRVRPEYSQGQPIKVRKYMIETIWIGVPLITFLCIYIWAAKIFMHQMQAPAGCLEIYGIGKQWMWKFQHPEGYREINELHVPVGRPVSVTLISQDVIHNFFVPDFHMKMDVLPGRYTVTWFEIKKPGKYRLFCSQYCGTWHARMTGWVIAMTQLEYDQWLKQGNPQQMAFEGQEIFKRVGCLQCHQANSKVPSPAMEGLFGRTVHLLNGQTVEADETYLRNSILDPRKDITAGYNNVMPTFKTQLNEEDILKLIEYIKSLSNDRSNNATSS